ncbi:MAG: glutathione peroxidase [Hyphomicrobium sp.]
MKTRLATAISLVAMLLSPASAEPTGNAMGNAFDFSFESIDGSPMPLAPLRGKVLLVVNTASFCGFTKQYAGLQELWTRYEDKGLVVIGVPSNDFGGQEPKAEGDIKKFCEGAFGVTFPLTTKQAVVGPNAHPFYAWATSAAGKGGDPAWNFHKYLVGRDGQLKKSFSSRLAPDSADVVAGIEAALAEAAPNAVSQ